MATKNSDGCTADCFLVVGDPDKPSTWSLQVKDPDGSPDHRLMGAAYAALTSNYRGQSYSGPDKVAALAALRKLYASEKMDWPGSSGKGEDASDGLEYKTLPVSIEAADDLPEDHFRLRAAVFNTVDRIGDVIAPGSFAGALPRFLAKGFVSPPDHMWRPPPEGRNALPIGRPTKAYEDAQGLVVEGRISKTRDGQDTLTLLRDGVISSASFGYRVKRARFLDSAAAKSELGWDDAEFKAATRGSGRRTIRYITEIDPLIEVSPATSPVHPDATVLAVKSDDSPAGLTLDEHVSTALAAVDDVIARYEDVTALRVKSGRVLSAANVSKLQDMHDSLSGHCDTIQSMITAASPADDDGDEAADAKAAREAAELKSRVLQERARFERLRFALADTA